MFKKIGQEKIRDLISVGVFIVTGVLFFIISGSSSFQVNTNFLANNNFASPSSTLFTPASRNLFNLEYRYLVIFILVVLIIKLSYKIYCSCKDQKNNKKFHHSIDSYLDSFSYSMFTVLLIILAGLQDFSTIIVIAISSFMGFKLILQNSQRDNGDDIKKWKTGIVFSSLAWIILVIYSAGTIVYGEVRSTWYIYLLDFICFIYLLFIAIDNNKFPKKNIKQKNRLDLYIINLLFKLVFLLILAIGLH
jgi:hypothetical protein